MNIVEAKLNTIIAAYDKLVKGIDDQAAMSRDRAYGGVIRAVKGELVESIATHLVQIAWEDVLHQNRARMEINKKKMPIGINEKYIERIADPRVKEYVVKHRAEFIYKFGTDVRCLLTADWYYPLNAKHTPKMQC